MSKVVEIGKDAKTLVKKTNQAIIDEIEKVQPDAIYMVYVKNGELFYLHPDLGIIHSLGALEYLKQAIWFEYTEGEETT